MTLQEIKNAVNDGKRVCWASTGYEVLYDEVGQWLIWCRMNDNYIGLTHRDEVTLNGREDQFFVDDRVVIDPVVAALEKAQRMLNRARCEVLHSTEPEGKGVSRGLAMDIAVVQDDIAPVLNRARENKWKRRQP